jgi:hypothetical protein
MRHTGIVRVQLLQEEYVLQGLEIFSETARILLEVLERGNLAFREYSSNLAQD